ncbi:hypothetical protein [Oryzisolibacter sp. LB2S]|uniref:hypothetical protein n=1 Tax=Alicycliphilus soli TaxID=3228789 RepID=UPI003458E5E7
MNAMQRAAHRMAWNSAARREFDVLGLPHLAPEQLQEAQHKARSPWLKAEYDATKCLEALRTHLRTNLHTCAQPDPSEALRLLDRLARAISEADHHASAIRALVILELDYLRPLCFGFEPRG